MLDCGSHLEATRLSRKSRNPSKRYQRVGVASGKVASQKFCLAVAEFRAIAPPAYQCGQEGTVISDG
jgi:hypothetical protein